ncbi:MAG: hypothetical protein AB7Q29_19315 [Vicinamibacterales bacterium]
MMRAPEPDLEVAWHGALWREAMPPPIYSRPVVMPVEDEPQPRACILAQLDSDWRSPSQIAAHAGRAWGLTVAVLRELVQEGLAECQPTGPRTGGRPGFLYRRRQR